MYASDLSGAHEKVQTSVGPSEYIYKRNFPREKFNLELFKIGHMYQVNDLLADCAHHLKSTITDENVMKLWVEGEKCDHDVLRSAVVDYFVRRTNETKLSDIPEFDKVVKPQGKTLKELLKALNEENMRHQTKISKLEEELKIFKGKAEKSIEDELFDVRVEWSKRGEMKSTCSVARPSEKIQAVLDRMNFPKMEGNGKKFFPDGNWHLKYKFHYVDRQRTFESYQITKNCQEVVYNGYAKLKLVHHHSSDSLNTARADSDSEF